MMKFEFFFTSLLLLMILMLFIFSMTNMHPIMMIIILISYSLLICVNMSMWKKNYMYSIIIFLIMISGLLIMFMYFASLVSNEPMELSVPPTTIMLIFMNSIWYYKLIINNNFTYLNHLKNLSKSMLNLNNINENYFNNFTMMYKSPFHNMFIISIFYLLITLFIIIKLCSLKALPLRKLNYV